MRKLPILCASCGEDKDLTILPESQSWDKRGVCARCFIILYPNEVSKIMLSKYNTAVYEIERGVSLEELGNAKWNDVDVYWNKMTWQVLKNHPKYAVNEYN